MKVIFEDVFIVPGDAPGLIAADMELVYMGNDTVQMRITPNNIVVNFSMIEMAEYLKMAQKVEEGKTA